MEIIIAPKAKSDMVGILAWTCDNFGIQTMRRYANLIQTAIEGVAANPEVAGSDNRPELAKGCRTYHIFHSRKKAGARGDRIRNPRHFLLYRVTGSGAVEIGRILHDSME